MSSTTQETPDLVFEAIKPIADPFHKGASDNKGTREIHLMTRSGGRKTLYLTLQGTAGGTYSPLLGFPQTCKRDELQGKIDNFVVPVIPRCYTTPDRDPAKADYPRQGWLYIIRRRPAKDSGMICELWRELKSNGNGTFSDVNLNRLSADKKVKLKKAEHRPATVQPGFRIVIPYQIANTAHEIWIAFSEVQWSQERIRQMKKNADQRDKRMHKLDLSDCLNKFKNCVPAPTESTHSKSSKQVATINDASGPAIIYNLRQANDDHSVAMREADKFTHAAGGRKVSLIEDIPVVYLDDPVGIARNLAKRYQAQCGLMIDKVKELESQNGTAAMKDGKYLPARWLNSAKLLNNILTVRTSRPRSLQELQQDEAKLRQEIEAEQKKRRQLTQTNQAPLYHYLDPAELDDTWRDKVKAQQQLRKKIDSKQEQLDTLEKQEKAEQKKHDGHLKAIVKLKDNVDMSLLEEALGKQAREKLRPDLISCKQALVDFLDKELLATDETPLLQALDDHFSLTALRNWDLYAAPKPNEPEADVQWPSAYADGWKAVSDLIQLLDKHQYDFDLDFIGDFDSWTLRRKDAGIALLIKLADVQTPLPLHSRLFPINKGAATDLYQYNAQKFSSQTGRHLVDSATIVSHFFKPFEEVIALRDQYDKAFEDQIERVKAQLVGLAGSVAGLDFQPVKTSSEELLTYYLEGKDSTSPLVKKVPIALVKSIRKVLQAQNETAKGSTTYRCEDAAGHDQLLKRVGRNHTAIHAIGGLLAIVEIINGVNGLQSISNSPSKTKDWTTYAELLGALCGLFEAAKDARDAAHQLSAYGSKVQADAVRQFSRLHKFQYGKIVGYIGNTVEYGLSFRSLIDNIEQGDDAALGDVLKMGAMLMTPAVASATAGTIAWATGLIIGSGGTAVIAIAFGVLVAAIRYYVFPESTNIELWAKNGPFGKELSFLGHKHGTQPDKMTAKIRDMSSGQEKNGTEIITGSALRYAIWCETPIEAEKALMDAVYRPTISVKETLLNQISLLQIRVDFPLLLPASKPTIQIERCESGYTEYIRDSYNQLHKGLAHKPVNETITYEMIDPTLATGTRRPLSEWTRDQNSFSLDLQNHHETKLTVMVCCDINGDKSLVIPYEPAFGDDTKADTDDKGTVTALWLFHRNLYDQPRNKRHDGNRRIFYDASSYSDL